MTSQSARRLAAFGLRNGLEELQPAFSSAEWAALLHEVVSHRLSGLLLEAIDRGSQPVLDGQRDQAEALHFDVMSRAVQLDGVLAGAANRLRAAGIEYRALKGSAHAHLLYPDPTLRPYVDVDLLVPGSQFADAVSALETLSFVRAARELRPGYDRRFGKGATLRRSDAAIDLHRTFVAGPYAFLVDYDAMFDRATAFVVGGVDVQTLCAEERLIHAAFHCVLSDAVPSLIAHRDVAQAVLTPDLDVDRVLGLASRWRATGVLVSAVRRAWSVLDLREEHRLVDWAATTPTGPGDRYLLWAYGGVRRRWARQSIAAVPVVPGWRAKVEYARAISRPSHADRAAG